VTDAMWKPYFWGLRVMIHDGGPWGICQGVWVQMSTVDQILQASIQASPFMNSGRGTATLPEEAACDGNGCSDAAGGAYPAVPGCVHHQALVRTRRDLHDQIGASLAAMVVQLELAQRLTTSDPAAADRALTELRTEAIEVLADVRRISATGRASEPCDITTALQAMIRRMNHAVGDRLRISLTVDGALGCIRGDTATAGFWIVREAVINVLKHARATRCEVVLAAGDNGLTVRVSDDGVGVSGHRRSGCGLANMAARAAERGGWCVAQPRRPQGFVVSAWLPTTAVAGRRSLQQPHRVSDQG